MTVHLAGGNYMVHLKINPSVPGDFVWKPVKIQVPCSIFGGEYSLNKTLHENYNSLRLCLKLT